MPTHAIICTHTTRHLASTLLGVVCQTPRPRSIVVSCDNDASEIAELVGNFAAQESCSVTLVQRPHLGASRSSQVRNNAVRSLLAGPAAPTDRLWFLDGDCCPAPGCLAVHERLGGRDRLVVGFRIDLTPEQTEELHLHEEAMRHGAWPVRDINEQMAQLKKRHRRYVRAAWLRRLGLGKPHKPKLLSANFSVPLQAYLDINGFDEEYTGYGQEDDDLGRRLYRSRVAPVVGVATALALHQFHPTRAPGDWEDSPNAARFLKPFATRCRMGVENPAPQPEPSVRTFSSSAERPPDEHPV